MNARDNFNGSNDEPQAGPIDLLARWDTELASPADCDQAHLLTCPRCQQQAPLKMICVKYNDIWLGRIACYACLEGQYTYEMQRQRWTGDPYLFDIDSWTLWRQIELSGLDVLNLNAELYDFVMGTVNDD